jgi:hypothetical protein
MMHLYFTGDPSKLVEAALQIAQEDRVGLFFGLAPDGKMELSAGEATLELSSEEIEALFGKLFDLAPL